MYGPFTHHSNGHVYALRERCLRVRREPPVDGAYLCGPALLNMLYIPYPDPINAGTPITAAKIPMVLSSIILSY